MPIPLLKPVMLYVSVITLISSYNIYAQAFVLASDVQGAPGHLVRVLVLDMLENSFRNYRVGYAAAEAVVLLVIVLVLTGAQFRLFRDQEPRVSDQDHPSSDVDRNTPAGLVIDVVLFAVGLMMLLPLVFLISNAFKTPPELLAWPPTIIPDRPTLENILGVLHETPLLHWIGNTLVFAVLSTASIVATSAIAGYVLGKFDLPWFPVVFGIIIATAIIPFEVYMIPLYLNVQAAGLLNTLARAPGRLSRHEFRHLPGAAICDDVDPRRAAGGRPGGWRRGALDLPADRAAADARPVGRRLPCWRSFRPGPPSHGRWSS